MWIPAFIQQRKRLKKYNVTMKYYIPIHRDSIDNITSAESVSPMDYYQGRGFGYHYFTPLNEVPSNKELFLFRRFPQISVSGERSEDVVIYIEIDDDKQIERLAQSPFNDGIRVAETIALYPWNCRIFFQTEEAMRQAVMMCKMSQNNKMWIYYDFDTLNSRPAPYKTDILKKIRPESEIIIQDKLKTEEKQNRLKGFLYSYILGRYFSISQPLASLLQTEKKMYDLASTLSGLSGYQGVELARELSELEGEYEKYDPNRAELQKKWKLMIEEHFASLTEQQAFESIIQELGGEHIMKNNFARKSGIELRPHIEVYGLRNSDWKAYKKELEDYTLQHLTTFRMRKGDTNTKEDFTIQGMQVKMNAKYGNFYGDLISKIVEGLEWLTINKLRLNRLDIASDLTRMVRDAMIEYGKEWEGSAERTFLNGLRQHIATGGTFDVTQAPDVILRSIAIFILKGDDFEEMMRYMEYYAQSDYRFVLGLWGACIGYTDMPKTVIQRMKLDYRGEDNIYMATCKLLVEVPEDVTLERHSYQFRKKVEPKASPLPLEVILMDKTIGFNKTQREAILSLWNDMGGKTGKEFFAKVSKIKGVGKVKIQRLRKAVDAGSPMEVEQAELFRNEPGVVKEHFDHSSWKYIEPLLPEDQQLRYWVKDDFTWFMNRDKWYEDDQRKIIDYGHHLYVKAHPKKASGSWTAGYFGRIDIEKITTRLLSIYDIKR